MVTLDFKDFQFQEKGDNIRFIFLRIFYFEVKKQVLGEISSFKINKNSITFEDIPEKKARNKFNIILEEGFKGLKSCLNNKKAVYVHQNSGIPLIGSNYFGLVDRGTNIIEIKPTTGCNSDCIYCSVDEGKSSRREVDFVVEENGKIIPIEVKLDAGDGRIERSLRSFIEAYKPKIALVVAYKQAEGKNKRRIKVGECIVEFTDALGMRQALSKALS